MIGRSDTKKPKTAVAYTDKAMNPDEQCRLCKFFLKSGACLRVAGAISSGGWCKLFIKRA